MIELAVQYWDYSTGDEVVEPVGSEREFAKVARSLRAHGVKPQPVVREVPEPGPWVIDQALQAKFNREFVETTVALLADGEINLASAADDLGLLASGLLHPHEAKRAERLGITVADDCTLLAWLERAGELNRKCARLRDGKDTKADTNDDAVSQRYEHHLNVLADIADHSTSENECRLCEGVRKKVVAMTVGARA